MATFFGGRIHSIPDYVIGDMETLVQFVQGLYKLNENPEIADTATRVGKYLHQYHEAEVEADEVDAIVSKLTPEQEEKLKEAHAKDYHGTDDDMPDRYEAWLEDLSSVELKQILGL